MGYRVDLFSIFIFLGIIQGIFLSFFFFSKENRQKQSHLFQGLFLVSIALCLVEIFLLYTGYIVNVIHLVDFSEPIALLIGPFFYLFVVSYINGKASAKNIWIQMAFPIFYTITFLPFLFSSSKAKYNSWIDAYHPELPLLPFEKDPRIFALTDWHTELVLLSLTIYISLSGFEIIKAFKAKRQSFIRPESIQLRMLRNKVLLTLAFLILIFVVKLFNQKDTGDQIFAAFASLIVYASSISVINGSGFFRQASLQEPQKYKSSTLSDQQLQQGLQKLKEIMATEKPFLQPSFSLSDLANILNLSTHSVSQMLNDGLGKSFFEMTAEYRIEEAKNLLRDQQNIKIEEIAEQVGYNSKSSFNTAFKKITGKTPSEYRSI